MKHGILATIGALLISASTINAADKSGALIIVSDLPESNDLHTALVEKIGHNNSDKVIYVKPAEASTAALPENVEGIVSIGIGTIRSSIDLAERSNLDYLGIFRKYLTNCLSVSYIICNFVENPRWTHHGLNRG